MAGCGNTFGSKSTASPFAGQRVSRRRPRRFAEYTGSRRPRRRGRMPREERAMRLGVLIPTRGVVMQSERRPPVEECWAMARHAADHGYDAVWVGDSIVAKPRLEPLTTLAYLSGITTRDRLGTAVLLPALRHPVVLAHRIANVDQISCGRVVLG